MILSIKELWQKDHCAPLPPPSPTGPYKRRCHSKEEESQWVLVEDRRRQNVAFENLAKEMLRYLENSKELKVGIAELQEQLEIPVQTGITLQQVAQQARTEIGQKVFEICWQEEEELCTASWASWDAQWQGLVESERRCHTNAEKDKKYV